jgi:hypothetical protein
MTPINELVEQIKQATDYQTNKRFLKEQILTDLHLAHNGGLFLLSPTVLAFVATWPNQELFLEDVYSNPIKIQRDDFLVQAQQHYHAVMNTWNIEHDKLRKIRKV